MKRTGKLIAGAAFAASLLFTKGIAPAFRPGDGQNCDGYSAAAEDYAETRSAEEISENFVEAEKVVCENELGAHAKSAYLAESKSGTEIFSKNETKRLPIASMCKIMTLLLAFDAVNTGVISMDESVIVSERAAGMGGSQVFLESGGEYKIRELLKSIAVCSANDSCVAIAEKIAGSEEAFVNRMNEKAQELGMRDTLFSNCTGLPKEPQYSCAKDVAAMLCKLIENEEYFGFCKVWTEKFQHPQGRVTEITNTNKLVRFYQGCDGGKTGFTSEAGFCLAATATRGGMRLVSVVIGEDSSAHRFGDVRGMFDYAFANYALKTVADENNPLEQKAGVRGGKKEEIAVKPERNAYIFGKRGEKENVTFSLELPEYVQAPVRAGDKVGEMILYKDNVEFDRVPVVAAETAERANFADRFKAILRGWRFGKS